MADDYIIKDETGTNQNLNKDRGDSSYAENVYIGIPSDNLTIGNSESNATLSTAITNTNTYLSGSSNDFHSIQITHDGTNYIILVIEYA